MPQADENSTAYLVEQVVIDGCKTTCRTQNIFHFQSDEPSEWPIVSVKAQPQGDDVAQIKYEGESAEVFLVYVVAEWPIAQENELKQKISAMQLDFLTKEIRDGVLSMGSQDSMDAFSFFDLDPFTDGEQDIEDDTQETPTRRVSILSFPCVVIRAS